MTPIISARYAGLGWQAAPLVQLKQFPPLICVATTQEIALNHIFGIQRSLVLAPAIAGFPLPGGRGFPAICRPQGGPLKWN
jgi:hypothetical protein